MKTFTFILTFLMIGIMAVAQDAVVIIDFEVAEETETYEGVTYNNWSADYTPATVDNPLAEGINSSPLCAYYPAHTFESEWGPFGGFFCIRDIDPQMWADYSYLTFKFLVMQDTVTTDDGISSYVKYEGSTSGADDFTDSENIVLERTYTEGGENAWDEVFIPIPESVKTSDFEDFCIITSEVNETGIPLELYYDDFRFTLWDDPTEVIGIEKLESDNGFSVYMVENTMNLRMDKAAFVQDVQVFDIKGSMLSHQVLNSNEKNFSIPVDIEAGVYMLRVRCDNEILARKFVKL